MSLKQLKVAPPRKILGVDASTNLMGFGLLVDGKLEAWGVLNYKGKDRFARAVDSYYKVKSFIERYGPFDLVVQEQAVSSVNHSVGLSLAQAYGVTLPLFIESSIKFTMVNPNEWQAALGKKIMTPSQIKKEWPGEKAHWYTEKSRQLRKQRNIDFVEDTYGVKLPFEANDAADGIGLAWFGYTNNVVL